MLLRRCQEHEYVDMYMIRNVSKNEISFGDLKMTLRAGRSLDLDMIASRYILEQSRSVAIALNEGLIKIIRKDGTTAPVLEQAPTSHASGSNVLSAMQEMEKRITENISAQIGKHISNTPPPSVDVDRLNLVLESIQNTLKTTNQSSRTETPSIEETNDEIVDIHAKVIDRTTRTVTGNIKHEETKSDNNIKENLDELENLL